jgi:hypothetical protein
MNDKKVTVTGGVGFTGLLTLVFIILKLCNVITWSWLWVLAPAWIPLALCITVIAFIYSVIGLATLVERIKKK